MLLFTLRKICIQCWFPLDLLNCFSEQTISEPELEEISSVKHLDVYIMPSKFPSSSSKNISCCCMCPLALPLIYNTAQSAKSWKVNQTTTKRHKTTTQTRTNRRKTTMKRHKSTIKRRLSTKRNITTT